MVTGGTNMRAISSFIINELQGKNASLDTIKMCVRIAMLASTSDPIERSEYKDIVWECMEGLPFDPMEPIY